jgi:hypothetical protein
MAYWRVEIKLPSYNVGTLYRSGQIHGPGALSLGKQLSVSMEAG